MYSSRFLVVKAQIFTKNVNYFDTDVEMVEISAHIIVQMLNKYQISIEPNMQWVEKLHVHTFCA